MLRTFTGFKGKMAAAQLGDVKFVLLAKNERQLRILWAHVMHQVELNPAGIKSAILIESATLPDAKPAPRHEDNLDRINASLSAETHQ